MSGKQEVKEAINEYFEERKVKSEEQEILEDARWWLDNASWDKKGKRAYAHSISKSLLSIAQSLDKIAKTAPTKSGGQDK